MILNLCLLAATSVASPSLERLFDELHETGVFHGNVLVAEAGEVVFERSYGLADDDTGAPLRADSVFELASVTKPLTATGILRLAEAGRLSLDDPVATHLAAFPYPPITLRQLLRHTSGLPSHHDAYGWLSESLQAGELLRNGDVLRVLVERQPELVSEPGEAFLYSNLNSILLAMVAESVCGCPFAEFLREEVFVPAGMEGAHVAPIQASPHEDLVRDYLPGEEPGEWIRSDRLEGMQWLTTLGSTRGDGGVHATARDLLAFDTALRDGRLLSEATWEEVLAPPRNAAGEELWEESWTRSAYGLGWRLGEDRQTHWHTGNWGGFNTCMKRYPDRDRVLVYFLNRRCDDWSWLGRLEAILQSEAPLR